MNKLAIVLLVFSFAACNTDNGSGPTGEKCTPNAAGATKCNATKLLRCQCSNGTDPTNDACPSGTDLIYMETQDCATSSKICVEAYAGVASCQDELPEVGQFEVCADFSGTDVATCETGLTCAESVWGDSACVTGCTGTCASGSYCDDSSPLFMEDFCYPVSDELEGCAPLAPDAACADDAICEWTTYGDWAFECHTMCDGATVNLGQGTCPTNTECLAGPYVETESNAGADVPCTTPGTPDVCTVADQYECLVVAGGSASKNLCARPVGWCGTEAQLHTDIASNYLGGLLTAFNSDNTVLCDVLESPARCGAAATGTADVECADLGNRLIVWIDNSGNPFECEDNPATTQVDERSIDCGFTYMGECFSTGTGDVCGVQEKACFAFCDDPADADGQDELTCPTALTCTEQPKPWTVEALVGPFTVQKTTDTPPVPKTCTASGDCDTLKRYDCVNLGSSSNPQRYCIRARKICLD